MKLFVKFDINQLSRVLLQEILDKFEVQCEVLGYGEIELKNDITPELNNLLTIELSKYGIEVVANPKSMLIQRTKEVIIEMVYNEDNLPAVKISSYLAEKLNHSYGYLSNLFSEITFSSIENYIILQKIERAKQLIINGEHTLTEISYLLNYSSVAHLSSQFKKTTGLTPSSFQRIIKRRQSNEFS
ncbi:MAG TPA: AraC family transcriptional regulator [Saprospiraceae bacterium]|nr:AraC family transcriptional regulator [Saprospiraceae bacterium]